MDKEVRVLNEQEIKDAFVGFLSAKMSKADWYYDYSDDPRELRSGYNEISGIIEELKLLSRLEGGLEAAKKLWEQHVPEYSVRTPSFFSNPKLLDDVLGGCMLKKDIPEVQKILGVMQSNGDRFVAFDNDALTMPKERFFGFPAATEAHDFAYVNTSPDETYIVYSIADFQRDLQCATDPDIWKAYTLKEVIDKMPDVGKAPQGRNYRGDVILVNQ